MNKLIGELQRLYFLDGQPRPPGLDAADAALAAPLQLVGPDGMVRTMILEFRQAGDWELVARLHQQIEDELDLPAPAISVSGRHGYRLWLSLAQPVAAARATMFLDALRRKYLADLLATHLRLLPDSAAPAFAEQVPALETTTGKWSAFIDPGLGAMFIDEPGLDMAPNLDRQADLLAAYRSISDEDFARALTILQQPAESADDAERPASEPSGEHRHAGRAAERLNLGDNFSDPQTFLLAVINDRSASAKRRIKAAKALLPYFAKLPPA
ncbi:MAG: hypothetical protein ACM3X0_12590 [Bacteroidota bacterium]